MPTGKRIGYERTKQKIKHQLLFPIRQNKSIRRVRSIDKKAKEEHAYNITNRKRKTSNTETNRDKKNNGGEIT